jgi:GntR family transcriptional regulator/MocR family aminotransferase
VPQARVQGVAAGLHAVALFDDRTLDEAALARDAWARGIELHGLSLNRLRPGPSGLVLGYAAMPEPAIAAAIAQLGRLIPRTFS